MKNDHIDNIKIQIENSTLEYCYILGLNNALKDLPDPPHFSPEIGATETLQKSPETAETMTSLVETKR